MQTAGARSRHPPEHREAREDADEGGEPGRDDAGLGESWIKIALGLRKDLELKCVRVCASALCCS